MSESETQLNAAVKTDVGVVRDHNEDAAFVDPDHRFFIVADGMGGHAAGEVASEMAVSTVKDELLEHADLIEEFARKPSDAGRKSLIEALEIAVRRAHQAVYDRGVAESDKQGMGTTLDVLLVAGADAFVAHVGDSRTYLIRDGRAAQITTDHTVAEVLVIEGKLSVEEAAASPLRTILVNAIGVAADVGVEMAHLRLRTGDYILLCSDGLHDYFPAEQELADHALDQDEIDDALVGMVELAKERGGHDNITGVLIQVAFAPEVEEQPDEDQGAVPEAIARDDTVPVDVDEVAPAGGKKHDQGSVPEVATQVGDLVKGASYRGERPPEGEGEGEGEGAGEGKPQSSSNKPRKKASEDLKTTVPLKPLKLPDSD